MHSTINNQPFVEFLSIQNMKEAGFSSISAYVESYVAQNEMKNKDKTTKLLYSMIQEAQFKFEMKISE